MDAREVVAIATYGGCKLRGPKGQLPDQRPAATEVCMRSPQLAASSDNKQV